RSLDEYSILTQGDCWCNNMMFLYENDKSTKDPIDMALIDWQLLRPASPAFDISYFFLTIASEAALNKCKDYLKLYHNELSEQIRLLGSEPEVLYPFPAFMKHWKDHCRFGFAMATIIIKVMLSEKDEVVNLEEIDLEDAEQLENLYPKFEKEEEFLRRMKVLAKYMIANGYL
ncbi:phosphotransferase, partial [Oryctes borbonicus]